MRYVFLRKGICPFFGGARKHIRTLEWKWKRDGTSVPLERVRSLAQEEGVDPYHLDLVLLPFFFFFNRVGFFSDLSQIEHSEPNLIHVKPA